MKISLFSIEEKRFECVVEAHIKGLNTKKSLLDISYANSKKQYEFKKELSIREGLKTIIEKIIHDCGITLSLAGIGHRFVHGGDKYVSSVRIDKTVMNTLEELSSLAPLHNDACLEGIKACFEYFGSDIPQVAIFDTAFHSSMPPVAAQYAIDHTLAHKYSIKRYGFHGIAHAFLWDTYAKKVSPHAKVITLHLGNGCSMAAIKNGRSLDTSMGFTPLEGLVMATRSGDIDPAIVEFLCLQEKKTVTEIMNLLNFNSGLLGVSGKSWRMEELLDAYKTNDHARLAVDLFCYRIVKYIGAYLTVLQGADALIFSGGIGENAPRIRQQIIQGMEWFGVKIDHTLNEKIVGLPAGAIEKVSASDSTVAVYVVGVEENLFIAQEVVAELY